MKLAIHTSDPNAALRLFQEMRALKIIPLQSTFLILFEKLI
jgi:pentatricopeptide repeat protein